MSWKSAIKSIENIDLPSKICYIRKHPPHKGAHMVTIHKRFIVDNTGRPTDVIIPYKDFTLIEELLGLDLDDDARQDLKIARNDRQINAEDAHVDLDEL